MSEILNEQSTIRWLIRMHDNERVIASFEKKMEKEVTPEEADIVEGILEIGQTFKRLFRHVVASKLSNN